MPPKSPLALQYQGSSAMTTPNDAAVSSNVPGPSTLFNARFGTFTRAHSLEIPGVDEDVSMTNWDLEFQDTPHRLDNCISEVWPELTEAPFAFDSKTLEQNKICEPSIDHSTDLPSECRPKMSKQAKRISNKKKIETLRDEVKELTAQLETLEGVASDSCQLKKRDSVRPEPSELWKNIAKRQLRHRQKSEEENKKLREMMDVQVHEATSLQSMLKRRTKLELLGNMFRIAERPKTTSHNSAQVFERMLLNIDNLCARAQSLFMEKGMQSSPCPGQKRRAMNSVRNGVCLELIDRRVVPHCAESTEKALWNALGHLELTGLQCVGGFAGDVQFRTEYSEQNRTTSLVSFFVACSDDYLAGTQVKKVVRKYVEANRSVFIYQTFMEPRMADGSIGTYSLGTLILEVQHQDAMISTGDSALIQNYFYVTRHDEGLPAGQWLTSPFYIDIGLAVWDEFISRIYHRVETSLAA